MTNFFSNLFSGDSPQLLNCLKCGKPADSRNFTKMPAAGKIYYYVECKCGSVSGFADSKEKAAERWNEMVKKDAGAYRRANQNLDGFLK